MKNILFFVPDGVGVRNYIYTGVLEKLADKADKVILAHSFDDKVLNDLFDKIDGVSFNNIRHLSYKENFIKKILREIISYSRLIYNSNLKNNNTIITGNWNPPKNTVLKKIFYKIVEFISNNYVSKEYSRIVKSQKIFENIISKKSREVQSWTELLKSNNIDTVFTTHQRALDNIPLFVAAKKIGIRTVMPIYSWDNVPKARIPVIPDEYIVWSEYMKEEIQEYYPEEVSKKILVLGSPQFSFNYNESFIIPREDFFELYNLDPNKKVVCFSGDDVTTSPFDGEFFRDVVEYCYELDIQIIFRRCPVDDGKRYDNILNENKWIVKDDPDWYLSSNGWMSTLPRSSDISKLVNICKYCDGVINFGSTMALDFAFFEKPALYLNYYPSVGENSYYIENRIKDNWGASKTYDFQHFKSMGSLDPVYWAYNKSDIKKWLTNVIQNRSHYKASDSVLWLDKIVQLDKVSDSVINIANCIIGGDGK